MNCPRCKTYLTSTSIKEIGSPLNIDTCNTCGGTWFKKDDFVRVEKIIEPVFIEIRKLPSKKEQAEPLSCPSCNNLQLLHKAEHPKDSKVIFDYCPICKGVWLDRGELDAIQKENWLITMRNIYKWLLKDE